MRIAALCAFFFSALLTVDAGARDRHSNDPDSNGDIHNVNSGIRINDGERVRNLRTVNGSIKVGDHAEFAAAKTVNGSITIGDDSHGTALSTTNGRVTLGKRTVIAGDIVTVNGRISLDDG